MFPLSRVLALTPVLILALAAFGPPQSTDSHNRRVRIHNETGWTMTRFYASDSRAEQWEEDVLVSAVIAPGGNAVIDIDDGSGTCVYDLRAEFANGQHLVRRRVNVCEIADFYYTR